jgi:hypothetical protein
MSVSVPPLSSVGGFAGLQNSISANTGSAQVAGAFGAAIAGNAALTTTALNLILVMNGIVQGLIKTMSVDEQFNTQRVKAIGSAVDVALLPGVYEGTFTINKAFLYGQTIDDALGGTVRPVVGQYLQSADFTSFYFNIIEANASGVAVAVRHDCVLTSVRKSYEIDSVTIMEDCSGFFRWSE